MVPMVAFMVMITVLVLVLLLFKPHIGRQLQVIFSLLHSGHSLSRILLVVVVVMVVIVLLGNLHENHVL